MRNWLRKRTRRSDSRQPLPARQAYDLWSASYGDGTNALQDLERESLLAVLPEVRGLSVLDAGCGTGRWTRELRQRGASVMGFDVSLGMLAKIPPEIRSPRLAAGLDRALPLRDTSFDMALCALVLGHLPEISTSIRELTRVIRPGGRLVISGFHPFATLQGWQRSFEYRSKGRKASGHIEQYVHLFSEYVSLLAENDLTLEALEEGLWQESPVVFALRAMKKDPRRE